MIKKSLFYNILILLVLAAYVIYTYVIMKSLGLEEESGSAGGIVTLILTAITIFMMIIAGLKSQSHFVVLWLFWIIWLLFDFFLFGLGGSGVADIFRVWFGPMSFLFFYMVTFKTKDVEKITFFGFIVLFALAFYMNLYELFDFQSVVFGEEVGITNLVFWCLCALPFLLLIDKAWVQVVFLLLAFFIIIITGKRSALISIALIIMVFAFTKIEGRHRTRNLFFIIVAGVGLYFFVTNYLQDTFLGVLERMSEMKEDQGSGRIPLYKDVFAVMNNNSLIDWLIGRGYGSIVLTKHTNTHNDALQLLFEYGIVGLIFYVFMIFFSWRRVKILRKKQSPYFLSYTSSFIIFIVLGLVSNLVVFYSYFAFICALWGIVEARIQANRYARLT